MGKKLLGTIGLIIALSQGVSAQNCLTAHFSAMVIQGEAMGRGMIGDDLGLGVNLVYGIPINSKLHFNLVASHLRYNIDYMQPGGENTSYYYGKGSHTSFGAGLMLFPFIKPGRAAMYNAYRFYIAGNGGLAFQHNETIDLINLPGGFEVHKGGKVLPYGELLFGVKIRMNPRTSVDLFAGGRSTLSDEIDGLIGTGAGFDIIGRVGIGFCTRLR